MLEQQIATKIDKLETGMKGIKAEIDYIKEMLEDSMLTAKEAEFVENALMKIKKGDKSDFVSLKQLKE